MTSRLRFFLAAALSVLLSAVSSSAQEDEALYRQEAGASALLYRGHQAFAYDLPYNGTYWWYSADFKPGSVRYNGKEYRGIPLNLNAARQELVIQATAGQGGKTLDARYVDSCRIGGILYLNLQKLLGPELPDGYWEVLYDGRTKFLKQVSKRLEQDLDGSKRALTGIDYSEYRMGVTNVFIYNADYGCLTETGQFVPVRRKRQLRNLFRAQKKEIRHYMSRLETNGLLDLEVYAPEMLKFVESR